MPMSSPVAIITTSIHANRKSPHIYIYNIYISNIYIYIISIYIYIQYLYIISIYLISIYIYNIYVCIYIYIYPCWQRNMCFANHQLWWLFSWFYFFWYIHTFSWLEIIEASPLAVFFPTISSHYPLHGGRTPPTPTVAVWKAPPSSVGASWVWFSHKRCPKFGSKQASFNGEKDDEP